MAVNYEDERFEAVEREKNEKLTETENIYTGMINESDQKFQDLIDASQTASDEQTRIQKERTEFEIERLEQQKKKAEKDYTKEQSAAYVDFQKETKKHGVNAEQMASAGFTGSGYSESARVNMYNTYQNRVATARASFNDAITEFENSITEARLNNDAILAEIALTTLQQKAEYALQGFYHRNDLILQKEARKTEIENTAWTKRQAVIDQINQEEALAAEERNRAASIAEQRRQFDLSLAEEQRQFNLANGGATGGDLFIDDSGSGDVAAQQKLNNAGYNYKPSTQIKTKYYNGSIAPNVGGFGYMGKDENGTAYQPKGVIDPDNGNAYQLEKLDGGTTVREYMERYGFDGSNATNTSGVNISNQNVWTANGKLYIWNGTKNSYEQIDANLK